jgi:hypothetical protein
MEKEIRCVMCGAKDYRIYVQDDKMVKEPFVYQDSKTKEYLCQRCAHLNEEIKRIKDGRGRICEH